VGEIDQHPTGKLLSSEGAYFGALVEAILEHDIDLKLGRVLLMNAEPELLLALPAGDETGLREIGRRH
jgi:hypothetical protein